MTDQPIIGDLDPEDAYDVADPPDQRVAVLERIAADLRDHPADPRRDWRRSDAIRLIDTAELDPIYDEELAGIRALLEAL